MRVCFRLALAALAFLPAAPAFSQAKKEKEKPAVALTSRAILSNLQLEFLSGNLPNSMKFSEFLEFTGKELQKNGRGLTFAVDYDAFRDEAGPDSPDPNEVEIRFRNLPPKITIGHLLRYALKQMATKGAIVVRAGKVDIVPISRTSKEYLLNQTFYAELKERRLDAALEELSELTGVSIVIDARAKPKTQTPVTAQFRDDVALQDAVRMLTDMAELKIVYLVTGIYVTTPEHAQVLEKELKRIYEGPSFAPMGPGGLDPSMAPPYSPLAPPLPPARGKRLEAAA